MYIRVSRTKILEVARVHKLTVIEDAAQAIGSRYKGQAAGTRGECGCFSFFPSKNLGGAGDGGLTVTNDGAMAERLRIIRMHGNQKKYYHEKLGTNSRLDALQAAVLRVKLPHLDNWAKDRQSRAEDYRKAFEELQLAPVVTAPATPQEQRVHVYNQCTIRCRLRDELKQFLMADGIPTEIYYPLYLHLQGAFSNLGYSVGDFPVAETASREVLSLPVYPELTDAQQDCVIQSIARFCAQQLYNRDECSGERTSL